MTEHNQALNNKVKEIVGEENYIKLVAYLISFNQITKNGFYEETKLMNTYLGLAYDIRYECQIPTELYIEFSNQF